MFIGQNYFYKLYKYVLIFSAAIHNVTYNEMGFFFKAFSSEPVTEKNIWLFCHERNVSFLI